jgi:hypothetical protein
VDTSGDQPGLGDYLLASLAVVSMAVFVLGLVYLSIQGFRTSDWRVVNILLSLGGVLFFSPSLWRMTFWSRRRRA